jgi:hypothetical protein
MSTSFTSQQLSKFQSACPIDAPWHGAHRYAGRQQIRIIDKSGPLHNFADRDHTIQYMVAVPLIFRVSD